MINFQFEMTGLSSYISQHPGNVANTLSGFGLQYLSPCTDVGFKKIISEDMDEGKNRSIRFVSSFCKILDKSNDVCCRMLDDSHILDARRAQSMDRIQESLNYNGEVVVINDNQNAGAGGRGGGRRAPAGLPAHPKIDSGFVVSCSDGIKFKIGIEMQARKEGNMCARIVDYGTRIFKYKKNENDVGYLKTYELALVRWGVQNDAKKVLSVLGLPGSFCDAAVPNGLVNGTPLCCAQIFLGASINAMDVILRALENNHRNEQNWTLSEEDKEIAKAAIAAEKDAQRNTLIGQMRILFGKEEGVAFEGWTDEEKECVNRIGFFKYGHLMSEEDVNGLNDANLKNDYECMRIKEENIMNNISDIEAIYGRLSPHDLEFLNEYQQLSTEYQQLSTENQRLNNENQQLKEQNNENQQLKEQIASLQRQLAAIEGRNIPKKGKSLNARNTVEAGHSKTKKSNRTDSDSHSLDKTKSGRSGNRSSSKNEKKKEEEK